MLKFALYVALAAQPEPAEPPAATSTVTPAVVQPASYRIAALTPIHVAIRANLSGRGAMKPMEKAKPTVEKAKDEAQLAKAGK